MGFSKKTGIFFSALIVAVGGIIYELIIGTASSYLVGNSILHFSLTIGFFLSGMGIGSWISKLFFKAAQDKFLITEILIAFIGGNSVSFLFFVFGYTRYFYPSLITLILVLGIFIGLEIPLILKIVSEKKDSIFNNISNILSLDYIGALIASIAFPLVLLPYLGILRTAYSVGLLNIIIAILIFFSFRETIKLNKTFISIILLLVAGQLFAGLVYSDKVTSLLDKKIYRDEVIYTKQSQYQKIVITKSNDDLRLFLDANLQFSTLDEYRYHESLVHIPALLTPKKDNVLILGGGDGLAVRELLKYKDIGSITLVDLDPAITDFFKTNNLVTKLNNDSLNNPKVKILNEDAFNFVNKTTELYNLIIIDLPDPNNESLAKLYSQEFYSLVNKRLTGDGVFVVQSTSPYFSKNTFWLIEKTIKSESEFTYPYHVYIPTFGEWGFVMGSKNKLNLNISEIPVETKYLTPELLSKFYVFDKDLLATNYDSLPINTIFSPEILKFYNKEEKQWIP